jgi:DNA-binding transcriptional ArsR family regulator
MQAHKIHKAKPINPKSIQKAQNTIPPENLLLIISGVFKALADETRTKILYVLRKKTLSVRDIAILVGTSESAVSHQLSYLKKRKLVINKRDGNVIYYSLSFKHISTFLKEAEFYADHIINNHPDHPYKNA